MPQQSKMDAMKDTEVLIAAISSHAKHVCRKERKRGAASPDGFAPAIDHLAARLNQESEEFASSMDMLEDYWKHIM